MQNQFYGKLLPAQGLYCVVGINSSGVVDQHFVKNVSEVLKQIEVLKDHTNVFVAPHSFNSHTRKAADAAYCRSLFIDLDVGDGPKKYPSQADAIGELVSFIDTVELAQPVIINSGTGVHAYWIFDEDIPSNVWAPYAHKFKAYCLEYLKIDPAVTADRARIMRAPETYNYKVIPPRQTGFWCDEIPVYDFKDMKEFLGGELPIPPVNVLEDVQKGVDDDTKAISNFSADVEHVFSVIVEKSLMGLSGCAQIKYILEHVKTLNEPLWRAGLSVAIRCLDGETAIQLMSEGHPGYTPEATIKKAHGTLEAKWAYGCEKFDEYNPGLCIKCHHKGKITGPIELGEYVKKDSPISPIRLMSKPEDLPPTFPLTMWPFYMSESGSIWCENAPIFDKKTKEKIDQDDIEISKYPIWPTKRIYHPIDGACIEWKYRLPKDKYREFQTPTRLMQSREEMIKLFNEHELTFSPPSKAALFMEYIVKWSQHMLSVDAAEQMRMQMGWTDDGEAFVIGGTEIRRTGIVLRAAASPLIHSIANLLRPYGEYSGWKKSIQELNTPSMEIHAFSVLCAFGSPLMRFMSTNGVTFGFTGDSGAGKTGALYAATSIFGSPVEMGVVGDKSQATGNALIGIYMALKNIMLGLDECSTRDAEDVARMIYQVASGRGKMRMQASKNALRDHEMSGSMIAMTTQNQSLEDKLRSHKSNPDGEMARYVEFQVSTPIAMINDPYLGNRCFEGVKANFGHAGVNYMQQVLKMGDNAVKDMGNKWIERFTKDFGKASAFRFYENLIGAAFAGAEISKNAEIINFDIERIYRMVILNMMKIKGNIRINIVDHVSILGEFQNRYINHALLIKGGQIISEPRNSLMIRGDLDTNIIYIIKRDFKKFLAETQINTRAFIDDAHATGLLVFDGKLRMAKAWSARSDMAPVDVFGFRFDFSKDPSNGPSART